MDVNGRKFSVIGLGRSGVAAVKLLVDRGAQVFASDLKKRSELGGVPEELEGMGVDLEYGAHSERVLQSEFVVVSPGVRSDISILRKATERGVPIISEVEIAYSFLDCPVVAVTGTNGKTTTAALIDHILRKAGLRSAVGGNIAPGVPLSGLVGRSLDFAVVEISTFQLETIRGFRPYIGVLTNITPDHLDRHSSFEEYRDLKARLFSNQSPEDYSVLNADDEEVMALAESVRSRRILFSVRGVVDDGVWVEGRDIRFRIFENSGRICSTSEVRLRGEFNLENSLAASAVCLLLDVKEKMIAQGLESFEGVVHRLEDVGRIKDIAFVNNSMCTNPTAAFRSLTAFSEPVVLIMGGKEKGFDTRLLTEAVARRAKHVVLIGEAAQRLSGELDEEGYSSQEIAHSMREAVEKAYAVACEGDTILLSPGFASFDMFRDFEERGDAFKKAFARLKSESR